jgi:hypothetical protein
VAASRAVMRKVQLESSRVVALMCVLLLLVFAGLEATHAHADGKVSASSCAMCVSAHASAPALTANPLPTLRPVARVAVQFETERPRTALRLAFFIRPPPSA